MRLRSLAPLVAALAVAGLAGCGSSAPRTTDAASGDAPGVAQDKTGTTASAAPGSKGGAVATSVPGRNGTAPGSVAPSAPSGAAGTSAKPTAPAATPSPSGSHIATAEEIPIAGVVTPACVMPGGLARLDVKSKPKAAIGYVAVYAGEKSGAVPPFGEGYGGNDKGNLDGQGNWSSSWTVAVNTPSGPARVIVVVASKGKQRQIEVPFSVGAREAGGCGT